MPLHDESHRSGGMHYHISLRNWADLLLFKIDNITIKPEIAGDESRPLPYQSPFLFKLFLPIGTIAEPKPTQAEQAVAAVQLDDPDALASKLLAVGR